MAFFNRPATDERVTRLAELENLIATRVEHFIAVGEALAEIRDKKLYQLTHDTFASYVEQRWGMTVRRAYQLIAGQVVVKSTSHDTASSAFGALPPDQQQHVVDVLNGNTSRKKKKRRKPRPMALKVPGGRVVIIATRSDADPAAMLDAARAALAQRAAA